MIAAKAESFLEKHCISGNEFTASCGCVLRFCRRTGIDNSVRLWGDAGSEDNEKVREPMEKACVKLKKYTPERIYNQDETGFMYYLYLIRFDKCTSAFEVLILPQRQPILNHLCQM